MRAIESRVMMVECYDGERMPAACPRPKLLTSKGLKVALEESLTDLWNSKNSGFSCQNSGNALQGTPKVQSTYGSCLYFKF